MCTSCAPITAGPLQKFFLRPCTRLMKCALFPAVWFIFGSQELTLKLPGRGSKPLRTTIKEHAPWKLKQVGTGISWPLTSPFCLPSLRPKIQDSANYFQLAQEQYRDIQANREALCSPEQISKTFNKFMGSLRQAEEVLVLPRLPNMQEIYGAEMRVRRFYVSKSYLTDSPLLLPPTFPSHPTPPPLFSSMCPRATSSLSYLRT